jgi:hypothetical protein
VVLTSNELVEIRAAQRTFEGAYVRTAIGQFSFALVVLKIFTAEFYSIGALFAVYGAGILFISLFRRQQGKFESQNEAAHERLRWKRADNHRQQTVLLRSRRRWSAQEEVSHQRERGLGLDGAEHVRLHLSAGPDAEACNLSGHEFGHTITRPVVTARMFESTSSVHVTAVVWDCSRIALIMVTTIGEAPLVETWGNMYHITRQGLGPYTHTP